MKITRRDQQTVEMQMGPMIDMVFLLLVFFMVTAKPIKPESDVGLQLPGTVEQDEVLDLPDEQRIEIRADGQVVLNDMPLDSPGAKDLPQLVRTLTRFREATVANQTEPMVTLDADDAVPHQRIVDVMNACALAEIKGVTFATGGDAEEEF
ncbi:MAG: ExbD/TolR family protein [Candidatus Methylacidiphilales bacterium]